MAAIDNGREARRLSPVASGKQSKTYRSAIVGARRGLHHARAYEGIVGMEIVALCELDPERLTHGMKHLDVPGYTSMEEMLEKERPDIVHAVARPTVPRAQFVEMAAAAGVKALVIEKPIGLKPSEVEAVSRAIERTGLKVIVNHQRRYMPFAFRLRELLASGELGQIHFIRVSTEGPLTDMATHVFDLALLAVGDVAPTHVWATAEGGSDFSIPNYLCPDSLIGTYSFPGGIRVLFESAEKALGTRDYRACNGRCNIDIWASRGRFWWRQFCQWGYQHDGMRWPELHSTNMEADDIPAQRLLTRAIADWLDDENKPHFSRFENAKLGMDSLLTGYRSALLGKRLEWPSALTDDEFDQLRGRLTGTEFAAPEVVGVRA